MFAFVAVLAVLIYSTQEFRKPCNGKFPFMLKELHDQMNMYVVQITNHEKTLQFNLFMVQTTLT